MTDINIDMKSVQNEALKELQEEQIESAKKKLKEKYRALKTAKKAVQNIEHEIELLIEDLSDE